jgi:coatomer protein complex subunit alpha (xenin)
VGAVVFEPLKPQFLSAYRSSRLYLSASASLPPLEVHVRRNPEEAEARNSLPICSKSLDSIVTTELKAAFAAFRGGRFTESEEGFKNVLRGLLLVVVDSQEGEAQVRSIFPLRYAFLCR